MLSGKYLNDVNRQNPLGTQGKLVEEFALLLRQLWSGESVYINPTKFKRVLEKVKPQFHGNDQHDAQVLRSYTSMHASILTSNCSHRSFWLSCLILCTKT
jgi:ubiquitin C-terminal hydrolase